MFPFPSFVHITYSAGIAFLHSWHIILRRIFPRRFHFIYLHIHYICSGIFLIATSAFSPVSAEYKRVASLQHFKTIFHRLMLMIFVIWCISPVVQWENNVFLGISLATFLNMSVLFLYSSHHRRTGGQCRVTDLLYILFFHS